MTKLKAFPRSAALERLLACLADGACCSIVGLSNTGKSTLLRAACESSARQQYLGCADKERGGGRKTGASEGAFFYVDCNLMLTMTEQGFYEATLRAVQAELKTMPKAAALLEQIEQLYRKVVEPPSAFVAPLSFNESVTALCEQIERRVVFLFDEFDEPFAGLDGRVFLNLRALRDSATRSYGSQLCFVTATEAPLAELRSDAEAFEFSELFAGRTHFLGMLTPGEAGQMAAQLAQQHAVELGAEEINFIVAQAGGHPGLLQAVANVVMRVSSGAPPEMRRHTLTLARQWLESDAAVRSECSRLWGQLTEADQNVMFQLMTTSETAPPFEQTRQRLINNGILVEQPALALFSPLFELFARRQFRARLPAQSGVYVDVDSGDVWVDGRKIATLTDLEYRLLLLLYGRMDKICDKYQVVEAVWGQEFIDEVDDARVEKLISRLRQKLESDPANPRYFQTVRGRGYRLISG